MSEPLAPTPGAEVLDVLSRQGGASQRSEQARVQFLSRVSHELRTPLNALLGFAQILELDRSEPLTSGQKARVSQIKAAGWQLVQLLNDLQDLSRIEAGQMELSMAAVALNRVVDQTLSRVSAHAASRQVRLELEASPETTVWGDATCLKQVLLNILSNAIQCSQPGDRVELRLVPHDGQRVLVSIRDSASPDRGSGIGLLVSHKLAQLTGAALEVRSTAAGGSEFRVILPTTGLQSGASRPPDTA